MSKSTVITGFLKKNIKYFHFLPYTQMAANYAKIARIGSLDEGFFNCSTCSEFLNFFTKLLWNINNLKSDSEEKQKIISNNFFSRSPIYYRNCIGLNYFWP